ncbi:acyltransferase domain-containing protein, partial [Streptomyces hainanensis]
DRTAQQRYDEHGRVDRVIDPENGATYYVYVLPWVLHGHTEAALRAQAGRLLDAPAAHRDPAAVGRALATGRAPMRHRAVLLGGTGPELRAGLAALAKGDSAPTLVSGAAADLDGAVFVFPGQGSQWAGMARGLLDASPAFAASVDACADALAPHVDWSLHQVLREEPGAPSLDRVDVVQPALFAVLVSLAEVWRAHGVTPAAVIGHSQGEIAAARVAGALSLPDAARVVALRSRALTRLAGGGGMVSVALPRDEAHELLTRWGDALSLAVVNGPGSVVVAGVPGALDELLAECERRDVRARRVPVDYASHSPAVAAIRDELLADLAGVTPRPARVPIHSTVSGQLLAGPELDAAYWYRNLRHTVDFEGATRRALAAGHRVFVEVSPHPVLTMAVEETLADADATGTLVLGTLRRGEGGPDRMLRSLAEGFVRGLPVDFSPALAGGSDERVALPTYAFQRRRYWPEPEAETVSLVPAPGDAGRDAAFWRAVEAGDVPALGGLLAAAAGEPAPAPA